MDSAQSEIDHVRVAISVLKARAYSDERAEALNHLRHALGLLELRAWRRRHQAIEASDDTSPHEYAGFPRWWRPNAINHVENLQTDAEGRIHEDAFIPQGGGH
jgi:hypothetical protein